VPRGTVLAFTFEYQISRYFSVMVRAEAGVAPSWRLGIEAVPGIETAEGRIMMRGGLSPGYAYM